MPEVLNKHHIKDIRQYADAVYIGRGSKWGNRFVIGVDGTREEVIEKHKEEFMNSELLGQIGELRDKDLICFCAPLACHGDLYLELANGKWGIGNLDVLKPDAK